jgi:serine/threonine protein kinase
MPSDIEALCQMANGLDYIHSKNVVHRDIKPDNVLISPSYILKISDFGFSKPTAPTGSFSANSGPQGTRIYYAPEYLQLEDNIKLTSEEKKNIRANKSIDIFSLGCLFFSYLMRKGPYTHLYATPNKQYNNEVSRRKWYNKHYRIQADALILNMMFFLFHFKEYQMDTMLLK